MIRLLIFFAFVLLISLGFAWFADRPGAMVIQWQDYEIETSLFTALVFAGLLTAFLLVLWSLLRNLISTPAMISDYFTQRKKSRGMDAISAGMIALGAGDRALAQRFSSQAKRALPNEPLTDLLRAQTAQISGDRGTARRIYESMLSSPETELLGLRGLFLEAKKENELEPARQFAERALRLNPSLEWSANALFDLQSRMGSWSDALKTLSIARKQGHVDKNLFGRRRAVLLTAQAGEREDENMDEALTLALEAHKLAPDLVPAADIAGRILASQGNTAKAAKIIQKTWKLSPHPDLARTYAFARPGDSPNDRLNRVKELASRAPNSLESPISIADAAIEAHAWETAREALEPLLEKRLTARTCILMAHIEGGQFGDKGRVREWLARAVHAPRDPAWTADGYISEHWSPISPITGELDSFDWQVPVDSMEEKDSNRLLEKLNVLAADALIEVKPADTITASGDGRDEGTAVDALTNQAGQKVEESEETDMEGQADGIERDEKVDTKALDESEAAASPLEERSDRPIVLDDQTESAGKPVSGAAMAATAAAASSGSQAKSASMEAGKKATQKADKKAGTPPAKSEEAGEELPQRLRSLPPPSPEIAPTSEPRIFVSPRPPDDPGPDQID